MLLSVIVPDKQPGMKRMLKRELEGIDAEIINKSWDKGLREAKGRFVCLLEKNSGISPGTIRKNINVFLEKPAYRKLAMVSPMLDFSTFPKEVAFGYNHGLQVKTGISTNIQTARIGCVPGAIVRTSSIRKHGIFSKNLLYGCFTTSIAFWENGLRIQLNPDTLYYAAEDVTYPKIKLGSSIYEHPSKELESMWQREMIT